MGGGREDCSRKCECLSLLCLPFMGSDPQEFDYDTEPRSYLLMIEASNQRSPPLTATTSLTVTLFDVNDERPEFSLSSYSFSVSFLAIHYQR